jgi:ATP-dependent protease HslVU (ClpYQ) peptidase subunit
MTVIVGKKTPTGIELVADSMVAAGHLIKSDKTMPVNKLFQVNGLGIGVTGRSRDSALLNIFSRNHKPATATTEGVVDFLFEFAAWVQSKSDQWECEFSALIAFEGKLFQAYDLLDVCEVPEFEAIGAGEDFAITALHLGKTAREAVQIACELSPWCRDPIKQIIC